MLVETQSTVKNVKNLRWRDRKYIDPVPSYSDTSLENDNFNTKFETNKAIRYIVAMTKTEEHERELEHLKWRIFIDFEKYLDVKQ